MANMHVFRDVGRAEIDQDTLVALGALYGGELQGLLAVDGGLSRSEIKRRWATKSRRQYDIVKHVWDSHVRWAVDEVPVAGDTALDGVLRSVPAPLRSDFPQKAQDAQRGDMCPCVVDEVALPPVGSRPVPVRDLSPDA